MEEVHLEKEIPIVMIKAESFPEGVMDAHRKLHALVPYAASRKYYGISWPDRNGNIQYYAGAELLNSDGASISGTESFTIHQGTFACLTIQDYMKDQQGIGTAFKTLLQLKALDPNGYCLEWYVSDKEVRCMVPLVSEK
jgi:predicted transcriptional regulator YdeE